MNFEGLIPIFGKTIDSILAGGPGVIGLSLLLNLFFAFWVWSQRKTLNESYSRYEQIVNKYHEGALTTAEALKAIVGIIEGLKK